MRAACSQDHCDFVPRMRYDIGIQRSPEISINLGCVLGGGSACATRHPVFSDNYCPAHRRYISYYSCSRKSAWGVHSNILVAHSQRLPGIAGGHMSSAGSGISSSSGMVGLSEAPSTPDARRLIFGRQCEGEHDRRANRRRGPRAAQFFLAFVNAMVWDTDSSEQARAMIQPPSSTEGGCIFYTNCS